MNENFSIFLCLTIGFIIGQRFVKNSCKTSQNREVNRFFPFRISPQQEIKTFLESCLNEKKIKGGAIVSCVGSTSSLVLRLANAAPGIDIKDCSLTISKPMEIVSLSGTLSLDGCHIHISVSDENGNVFGGHLVSALVHTTCEVVIVELNQLSRVFDSRTGFKELTVLPECTC
jgi:predicted DNA-binding protein with PD1-like motif